MQNFSMNNGYLNMHADQTARAYVVQMHFAERTYVCAHNISHL